MRADLLLLDANPLADVSSVRRVAGVAVAGRWLDAERLEAPWTGPDDPHSLPSRYRDGGARFRTPAA